ncbi:MAG: hypothetical protein J7L50_03080 [Candidatus Odinarchaeota archaeon]|nr:hypothetical protein [Candidatus Odinarchaeota archaeon]
MKRTILGLIISFFVTVGTTFFLIGGTVELLQEIITDPNIAQRLQETLSLIFLIMLNPYTLMQSGSYFAIGAWALGGFVGGLICKKETRAFIMSILLVVIIFISAPFLLGVAIDVWISTFTNYAIDLGVAFGANFVPAVFGALITKEK